MLANGKKPTPTRQVDTGASAAGEPEQTQGTPDPASLLNTQQDQTSSPTPPRTKEKVLADIDKLENERSRWKKYSRGKSPITKLRADQLALEAAQSSFARIAGQSLFNFLR